MPDYWSMVVGDSLFLVAVVGFAVFVTVMAAAVFRARLRGGNVAIRLAFPRCPWCGEPAALQAVRPDGWKCKRCECLVDGRGRPVQSPSATGERCVLLADQPGKRGSERGPHDGCYRGEHLEYDEGDCRD